MTQTLEGTEALPSLIVPSQPPLELLVVKTSGSFVGALEIRVGPDVHLLSVHS